MTYFPPNVFNNIKAYAGFDPTWRYKKIAKAVKAHVKWTIFTNENEWAGPARTMIVFVRDGCGDLFSKGKKNSFKFIYKPYVWSRSYEGYGNILGLPSTIKKYNYDCMYYRLGPPTRIRQHILLDNWITQTTGPKNLTMKDLKQYCRDNKMKGYSKFKKTELIRFIMKYEFD